MKNVSNLFKETLASGGRTYKVYASFTLADGETLALGSEDIWSGSVVLDTATSGTGSFDVGAFVMSQVSFTVNNLDGGYGDHYFDGARVWVDLGLVLTDGTEERVHLGVFNVNRTNAVNSALIQLTALDNAVKFEKPYSLSTLTYPATIGTIIRDACQACSVDLVTQSWAGDDMVVQARPEKEYSFRQIVSYAAQACGLFAHMNDAGYLELKWYDTDALGAVDDEDTWEGISAALKAKYHHIKSLSSTNINTDLITISGVTVSVGSGDDLTEKTVGTEDYLLKIKDNPLIDRQNQQTALTYIAASTVGMEFYKFSINCLSDPTIEAGDLIWITDKDGKSYRAPITLTSFKVGSYERLECSATLPQENKSYRVPASTIALIKAEKAARERIDKWAETQTTLSELISAGYGMYTTNVTQADGSIVSYMHDKPTMAESAVIWTKTAEGLMLSRDGGTTFALDSYGHALVETLTAHGVSADWINAGELVVRDALGNETMYVNCGTGEVRISATSFSLTGKTVPQIIAEQVEDVEVGARNLLLNSSFSEDFNKWGKNARYELVTEDGYPCGHITGGTGAYAINQAILERIKDDEEGQLYTVSGDIKLVKYADNSGSQAPYLSFYLTGHYLDGSGNSKWIGATRVGGTTGESSQRQFMPFSDQGWVRVNYIFKFAKKPSELTDMAFDIYTRNWSGDLYFKNLKLERGNKATDWTPAPEDLQTGITNANTAAQQANATANAANTTAQQALDVASSAGGMSAYLDNDYQSIPTDADGTYTTFPECSTKITVFYNSADVSAQCTYTATPSTGVTGSWNASTRTYTVTGLTAESGTVTIRADYNNTSLSRKFSIAKVRRGAAGTDGRDGTDGQDGTNGTDGRGVSQVSEFYQISASGTTVPASWETTPVKPTVDSPYLWSFTRVSYTDGTTADTAPRVIGNYAADGQDGANGRGVQSVTAHYGLSAATDTEPAEWSDTMVTTTTTNKYLWSYETITYTDGTTTDTTKRIIGTHGATGTAAYTYTLLVSDAAIVKNPDGTLSPSTLTLTAKRAQGTKAPANYSGRFKIETSTDGTTWTATYTSSSNVATYIYTVPAGVKLIRCSLYLAGGVTTLLDSQTVPIVADGVDGIDGVDGFSPVITSSKSNGVTTVTITDAEGTRTVTINDGKDGSYVKTVTNYYLASASGSGVTASTTGWTTDPTATAAKMTAAKPYLWNYEVLKDETGTTISTTSPAVIGHFGADGANGTNGTDGTNGKGIKSITEYYALSTSTTAPATADFSSTVKTPTAAIRYLWNYEKITYTDDTTTTTSKHIIGVYGESGKDGQDAYTVVLTNENHTFAAGTSAAVAGSAECSVIAYKGGTRVPATIGTITGQVTGMSTEITDNATNSAKFTVNVTTAMKTASGVLTVPVTVDGKSFTKTFTWTLALHGAAAYNYELHASDVAIVKGKDGALSPATITFSATRASGTGTPAAYAGRFKIETTTNGTTWTTAYTSSANESSKAYSPGTSVRSMRCSLYLAGGTTTLLDSQTVPIISDGTDGKNGANGTNGKDGKDGADGADAYTVLLTNESHIFAAGTSAAVAGSTDCSVVAYKGTTRTAATIGTITGQVAGLTTSITGNGTTDAKFTVTVTTSLKTAAGILTIPVTVDGKTFTKAFSWSLALKGSAAYNYELICSEAAIVKGKDGTMKPSSIKLSSTRGSGTSKPAAYAGRFVVEASTDGTEWTALYTSAANENNYTFSAPPASSAVRLIRCSLYLAGGTTTLLDSQTIPIVEDGTDGISPVITSSKSGGVTTITITDASGTRTLTVNDGTNGASIKTVTNYYLASASSSGVTTSTSGWTTNPAASAATITAAKPYLWNYEISKDSNGTTISTTSPAIIGHFGANGTNGTNGTNGKDGADGKDGTDGKGVKTITEYYALSTTTTAPADSAFGTAVKTPTATFKYLWNYETITYTDNSTTTTAKHIIGVYGDTGADAYTVVLTNESHTFPGTASGAMASSASCSVQAYKGATRIAATIGAITGQVTGLTTAISSNGTTNAKFTVTVTTALKASSGTLAIPVTVDGKTFTKTFSWSVARNGVDGRDGTNGSNGQDGANGKDGADGQDGAPARMYFLKVSPKSTKIIENLTFDPNTVTVEAYYKDGNSITQTAFAGYLTLQACVGGTWKALKSLTASSYTFVLAYTSNANASISGTTVSLPSTASALRIQLRATSSGAILDQEEIIVLIDATSITQETIWNKLTNNGQTQGVYMEGGKIYINASYIGTGTLNADRLKGISLKLGGQNDEHGLLTVVDAGNEEKVRLDHLGIHAIAGNIGNWEIINNTIRREQHDGADVLIQAPAVGASAGSSVLSIGAPYTSGSVSWGDAPFRVTKAGAMYSTKGYIGGWEITSNSMRNATKGSSENTLLGAGTKYPLSVGASWATSDSAPNWGGAVFRVQNTGHMTAKSASITGTFTTTDGRQSITMQNGIIYGKQGTTESGIIDMSAEYPSDGGGNRNIAIKGNYALRLQGGNIITLEVPALERRAWITRSGLTAQELHAVNGYSGYITFPISIDPETGTLLEWIRLQVVDGIIRG